MKNGKSDIIDIACEKRFEKDKAVAVFCGEYEDTPDTRSKTGKKEKWVWLPKSQVQDNEDGTFAMPEWLAKDKGLI